MKNRSYNENNSDFHNINVTSDKLSPYLEYL
jgi:hypothetical protein